MDNRRILNWEGSYNARDLGGYPAEDGHETMWHRVVRADTLARLTNRGRETLVTHGIQTIIDLRLPRELDDSPSPFRYHDRVAYRHLSMVENAVKQSQTESLVEDYIMILDRFKNQIGRIMVAIAMASPGGVVIHCHSGKDRTGIIAALLLRLAGVPRYLVAQDYALTTACLWPLDREWLADGPGARCERERQYSYFRARVEVMDEVIRSLEDSYGSVAFYLGAAGAASGVQYLLRSRLLGERTSGTRESQSLDVAGSGLMPSN